MAAKPKTTKDETTFEESMKRLEDLVEKMESSDLPLEELIGCYEEGVQLVKVCSTKLDAVEKRIQIIASQSNGETVLEEFDPSSAPETEIYKNLDDVSLF